MPDKDGWIEITDGCELPEYDKDVLIYYEWTSSDKKDPTTYECIEIGNRYNTNKGKDYERHQWRDKEYNDREPSHWQPLPNKPIKK
jgi:hypothetical protein